jgi:ribonuclease P protein component
MRDRLDGIPTGSLLVVRAAPAAATASTAGLAADLDGALHALRSSGKARPSR